MVVAGLSVAAEGAAAGARLHGADYSEAEKFMQYGVNPLVLHTVDHPIWLADGHLLYRDSTAEGYTLMLVDPARRTVTPAFDQQRIATALTEGLRSGAIHLPLAPQVDPNHLPIDDVAFEGKSAVVLEIAGQRVRCDVQGTGECISADAVRPASGADGDLSPDGSKRRVRATK